MVRPSIMAVFLFSIGVALGYFSNFRPSCPAVTIVLSLPSKLTVPDFSERSANCVRDAIYNESRNQGLSGRIAVGQVVINRASSGSWGTHDICEIFHTPRQFDDSSPAPVSILDKAALQDAEEMAHYLLSYPQSVQPEFKEFYFFNSNPPREGAYTIGDLHFYTNL